MKRAFSGSGPEIDARYQRAGMWLLAAIYGKTEAQTWCDKAGVRVIKAQSEGIGSAGGFLVPIELERAILDLRDSFGAFRRRACIWPMGSDSSVFPRRTGTAAAYFFAENAAATSTSLTMDDVKLTAKKLGALVTVSSELDEDSIVDLVDYVANEMAWALASKEDDCAFYGDGTATYGGMRGATVIAADGSHAKAKVTAGFNTYDLVSGTDLGGLVGAVRASALPRAAWFVSSVGYGHTMARLAAGAGGGNISTGYVDGIPTTFFNGYPVVLTQKFPLSTSSLAGTAMMAFGDMYAAAVLGQRRGLTIARSNDRYLDTDQIGILVTERFDAVLHDLGDNSNLGSFAVLFAP